MFSFEEAGGILDGLADELPEEIFKDLNGGVSLIEESVNDEGIVLGTYFSNEMGRYIELYYGSFVELYGEMDDEKFTDRLRRTLHHELTHHIESMAGDHSLERWDERLDQLYGFGGINVNSILFVSEDDSALSPAAKVMFDEYKQGHAAQVSAASAAVKCAGTVNIGAAKGCMKLGLDISDYKPVLISPEMAEQYDVILCMTAADGERLIDIFPEFNDKIMCLCEDDLCPPSLSLGWKRCLTRLKDEVLAVIDELNQEYDDGL